jgi:hypothetical protein
MSERITESARLGLARLRALGVGTPTAPLESAAERAGRAVVDVSTGGERLRILSWAEGLGPEAGPVRSPSAKPLETTVLAACLGICWHERAEHPWPGVPGAEDSVLRALASARGVTPDDRYAGLVHKVIASLRESSWLDTRVDAVRLGPRVAAWTENDVAVLRTVFHKLPRIPETGGGAS